jgi:lysozyme
MLYSKDGLSLTERFEGCRLEAYPDIRGIWTIGYGHTGPDVHPEMCITQAQVEAYLLKDV